MFCNKKASFKDKSITRNSRVEINKNAILVKGKSRGATLYCITADQQNDGEEKKSHRERETPPFCKDMISRNLWQTQTELHGFPASCKEERATELVAKPRDCHVVRHFSCMHKNSILSVALFSGN